MPQRPGPAQSPGAADSQEELTHPTLTQRLQAKQLKAQQRFEGSTAERLWSRLDSMDFINRGMLFAAVLLLCMIPFLIVVSALAGRSATAGVVRHFGLNQAASKDVATVFTSPSSTSSAISGLSWVFFVLGGIAAATALQGLYEAAFELDSRGLKDTHRRLVWLAAFVGALALAGWVGPWMHKHGGPLLIAVASFVVLLVFWWFTIWFLLSGRRSWREVFPSALATASCWLGMSFVFRLIMSSSVTEDYKKYGPIGVVFALMSFLIAVGVVVILGAIAGLVWHEERLARKASPQDLR